MKILLYSTGCPKCNVLSKKLDNKGITYTIVNDIDEMTELGIMQVPVLSVDGCLLPFDKAVDWVNGMEMVE